MGIISFNKNTGTHMSASSVTKKSKASTLWSDNNVRSWEFNKNIKGSWTEKIGDMFNIPSMVFTPNLSMPSFDWISDVAAAVQVTKALFTKLKQLSAITYNGENLSKEIVKKSIGYQCIMYQKGER